AGDRSASLTLIGAPLAMLALPQGGFAVLLVEGTHGRIVEIAADGTPGGTISVELVGRDLTYNASTRTYAVAGNTGVAFATVGGVSVVAPGPAANAQPSSGPSTAAAKPSSPPTNTTQVAVSPPAPVAVERQARVDLPDGARLAWKGVYRFDLV